MHACIHAWTRVEQIGIYALVGYIYLIITHTEHTKVPQKHTVRFQASCCII